MYDFLIMVMPVGKYYKEGLKGVPALVCEDYDRAAPKGMGQYKVAGNYGASLMPAKLAKQAGYPIPLFLDPKEHKYIDEFGTSNFLAITKDGKYVTSDSPSILPSVTNMSLMQVAKDLGHIVEKRKVEATELPDFVEVDACGTAVVITPISSITIGGKVIEYGNECGPVSKKLYDTLTGIQYGELEDTHNWMFEI
jgi:branched-chain amino acid aminotransferase